MATRKFKLAKYIICAVGLASDSVGTVTIDGKITLIQPHAESNLYLCPLSPYPQPTYQQSWFFSDCLAYEHDIPAIVYPTPSELRQFKYRFIHYGPTKPQEISTAIPGNDGRWATKTAIKRPLGADLVTRKFYMDHLLTILGETRELHHGPLTYVLFRYYNTNGQIDLPLTKQYGPVAQDIHLYASALRQSDALSEYLSYYRVIESVTGGKHRDWIEKSFAKIREHRYGDFPIAHQEDRPFDKPRDIMKVYRRRALLRLNALTKRWGSFHKVALYFYNINRCGIAHGQRILKSELTPTYFEVVKDTYILKLLARIAIDEKMKSAN